MSLDKLHIPRCFLEVAGDQTYTLPVDRMKVTPEFDVEQWEFSSGTIAQAIGDTRLFFTLEYGRLEPAPGSSALGLAALIQKFMSGVDIFLGPDADQPATKFQVLFRYSQAGPLIRTDKGTISRRALIPLATKDRLPATDLQFFNFI